MKIVRVEAYPVRVPIKPARRVPAALGGRDASEILIVRVATDEGVDGVGEGTGTARWSGETAGGARTMVERVLGPAVVGADPRAVADIDRRMDRVCKHNWFTKAAIEMACWDIQGKATGRPVYELLGGPRRPRAVRGRASMAALAPRDAGAWAAAAAAAGFTAIKIKVGGEPTEDVERVRAVRQAVGPAVSLVIDATGGWTADTAIDCVRRLAGSAVAWVEQPTPAGDYAALARVRRETGCRIIADDACFDLVQVAELLRQECCDALSVYPGKNGGIGKAQAIVEYAAARGIPCTIGSNLESDVGTAAMGHLVVGCENLRVETIPGDMLGPDSYEVSIGRPGVPIEGPITTVLDGPGLGLNVDWDAVRAHACRE